MSAKAAAISSFEQASNQELVGVRIAAHQIDGLAGTLQKQLHYIGHRMAERLHRGMTFVRRRRDNKLNESTII